MKLLMNKEEQEEEEVRRKQCGSIREKGVVASVLA